MHVRNASKAIIFDECQWLRVANALEKCRKLMLIAPHVQKYVSSNNFLVNYISTSPINKHMCTAHCHWMFKIDIVRMWEMIGGCGIVWTQVSHSIPNIDECTLFHLLCAKERLILFILSFWRAFHLLLFYFLIFVHVTVVRFFVSVCLSLSQSVDSLFRNGKNTNVNRIIRWYFSFCRLLSFFPLFFSQTHKN